MKHYKSTRESSFFQRITSEGHLIYDSSTKFGQTELPEITEYPPYEQCRPYNPKALSNTLRRHGQIIGATIEDKGITVSAAGVDDTYMTDNLSLPTTGNDFLLEHPVGGDPLPQISVAEPSLLTDGPSTGYRLVIDAAVNNFRINPNNQAAENTRITSDYAETGEAVLGASFIGYPVSPSIGIAERLADIRLVGHGYQPPYNPVDNPSRDFAFGPHYEVLVVFSFVKDAGGNGYIRVDFSEATDLDTASFSTAISIPDDTTTRYYSFSVKYTGNTEGTGHSPPTVTNLRGNIEATVIILDEDGTDVIDETFSNTFQVYWPGDASNVPIVNNLDCNRFWTQLLAEKVPAAWKISSNWTGTESLFSDNANFAVSHIGLNFVDKATVKLGLERNESSYTLPEFCNI